MDIKEIETLHYTNILVENIGQIINERGWSLKKLSDESNMPYDTLKKLMSGKTGCPTVYNLILLSNALGVSIDYLLGRQFDFNIDFNKLPKRAYSLISEIANIETQLYQLNREQNKHYIPLIIPTGRMGDEMIYESMNMDYVDVSPYYADFGESMMCGIKITNKSLHPTFLENDILIISNDRHPNYGETGIFIRNRRVYIRKYLYGTPSVLEPINGFGTPIVVEDSSEWTIFGRVLTIIRS